MVRDWSMCCLVLRSFAHGFVWGTRAALSYRTTTLRGCHNHFQFVVDAKRCCSPRGLQQRNDVKAVRRKRINERK